MLEEVAHCALELLLSGRIVRDSGKSEVASDVHCWSAREDSHVHQIDDSSARDSERKHLLGASHVTLDSQVTAMSHAAIRRTLLDGMPVGAVADTPAVVEETRASDGGDGGRTIIHAEAGEVPRLRQQPSRSGLSTSMFRIHQYNSSEASLRGSRISAMQLVLGLRGQLQRLLRRLPCHALLSALFSGTTGGVLQALASTPLMLQKISPLTRSECHCAAGIPGLHADLGLVTVAPKSSAAGLLICTDSSMCTTCPIAAFVAMLSTTPVAACCLDSRGRWKLVEAEMEQDDVVVFAGFSLGWITRGACECTVLSHQTMSLHVPLFFGSVPCEYHG